MPGEGVHRMEGQREVTDAAADLLRAIFAPDPLTPLAEGFGLEPCDGGAASTRTYYVLVCRDCGDGDDALPMPFGSAEERGKWAAAHTRGTGHNRWFVTDQKVPQGRATRR